MKTFAKFSSVLVFILLLVYDAYGACTVSSTGINFGNYDVFSIMPLDSTGSITVDCSIPPAPPNPPVNVIISIGPSNNSGGFNPRKMKHSSMSDMLNYYLYTDSSMTAIWGDETGGTSIVTKQKVKKVDPPLVTTIYGRIPPGQNVSVGPYSETLTVTITW